MMFFPVLASIAIVTNGVCVSRIQLHRNASDVEVRAAKELRETIQKMVYTDINYTITPGTDFIGKPNGGAEIVLVTEEWGKGLLPKRAVEKLAATKNPEAFVICSREDRGCGKAICIAGKTPIAVYYGVYAFLEDYLGCGFYHAAADGTVIPKVKTIEVAEDIFDFREPWIKYRRMSCWSGACKPIPLIDMFRWQVKRTYQHWYDGTLRGRMTFGENELTDAHLANLPFQDGGEPYSNQVIPDSLFKDHPEYFTLIDGKRVPGTFPARRCYSNPDVIRRFIDFGVQAADYGNYIAIQMTDTPQGWCECEDCRKYGMDKNGVWSGENYAHRFMGEVAAGILAQRPNADVAIDAYLHWREIPTCDFRRDRRVKCVFAPHQRCYVHALDDDSHPCNRHFHELYENWLKLFPRNGIFDYYCYSCTGYAPIEYVLERDMKYYHKCGLEHFVEDTSGLGEGDNAYPISNWPFYYILSKFIWDPNLSVEGELDKVYRRYYGRAAEPMLKYHALRRRLWENAPGHAYMGCMPRHGLCLLEPGSQEELENLLTEAALLAKGDKDLESRVNRDRTLLNEFWIKQYENVKAKRANRKSVPVARAAKDAIRIDGVLDEAVWKNAKVLTGVMPREGQPKAVTNFRVAQDGENWYFSAEAFADAPRSKVTNRDGFLWEDDCVEFAVSTPKGDYYHFIANANGALYDACGMAVDYDYGGEMKVVRTADRYVVELRAPVRGMEFSKVGEGGEWGFYCARAFLTDDPKSRQPCDLNGGYAHDPITYSKAEFDISQTEERKLSVSEYRDRMAGAWMGQSVGVAYGAPTEFKKKGECILPDDLVPAWKPERVNNTFQQDDLYVEMSFIETLEKRGVDVGPREAGIDFANSRYRLWCANSNARDLIRRGIAAPDSSHPKNHPTTDDIDYQIEADFSGILSPGLPTRVLKFGQNFGRIMNYGDGAYAGDFMGGMYAAAYFEKDRVKVVEAGLECIPAESWYAEMVRDMLAWYKADPKDWKAAWKKAVAKYGVDKGPRLGKVSFYAIDVKINGAMVLLGYLWGEGDIFRTMDIATRGGYDSDCNPSSALGILGVQLGLKAFGPEYVSKLDKTAKWEYTSYTWDKLLAVCEKLTRDIVVREGGKIGRDEKGEYFLIPVKAAVPGPAVSSRKPGPGGDARLTDEEKKSILYAPCGKHGAPSEILRNF